MSGLCVSSSMTTMTRRSRSGSRVPACLAGGWSKDWPDELFSDFEVSSKFEVFSEFDGTV